MQGKILTNTMAGVVNLTGDSVRMAAGGAMELTMNSAKLATSSAEMAKNSGKLAKEQAFRAAAEVKAQQRAERKLNAAMHKMTQETDQAGQRLARRTGLLTGRIFSVWLGGPVVVLILIPMAYASNLAFEALANLVWNACFVHISVRPVSSPKPAVRVIPPPPSPAIISLLVCVMMHRSGCRFAIQAPLQSLSTSTTQTMTGARRSSSD